MNLLETSKNNIAKALQNRAFSNGFVAIKLHAQS
jgi:hypothetical protein